MNYNSLYDTGQDYYLDQHDMYFQKLRISPELK